MCLSGSCGPLVDRLWLWNRDILGNLHILASGPCLGIDHVHEPMPTSGQVENHSPTAEAQRQSADSARKILANLSQRDAR
jgi:hypothetical protein